MSIHEIHYSSSSPSSRQLPLSIIDRYMLRQFVQNLVICFLSLTGLYVVIDAFGALVGLLTSRVFTVYRRATPSADVPDSGARPVPSESA